MKEEFGAFGKIPSAGDFFRLSPPPGFVRVWDAWVQQTLLTGGEAYGPQFDALYMSAPIWRFTLPRGTAGQTKIMGVVMPSVDRVGRRFPLTLMAPLSTPGPAPVDHLGAERVFEKLEDLALLALEDTTTQAHLRNGLQTIPIPSPPDAPPIRAMGATVVVTGIAASNDLARVLGGQLLAQNLPDAAVWSAVLDGVPRLLACPGLPQGGTALALFDMAAPIWREATPL